MVLRCGCGCGCLHAAAGPLAAQACASDDERRAIGELSAKIQDMVSSASTLAVAAVADKVGLFKLLAQAKQPLTADAIARLGGYHPRYVTEVCSSLACAGLLVSDGEKFELSAAQTRLLADPKFPLAMGGWLQLVPTLYNAVPGVSAAMTTPSETTGVPYSLFSDWGFAEAMDRLNGPGIEAAYVRKWLPSLPGAAAELERGIVVADLGCGSGRLALTLGQAFPNSRIVGVDLDEGSIERARSNLAATALTNVSFLCKDLAETQPNSFDLCVNHDCIHDLVDPVGVLNAVRRSLKPTGRFFSMEPKVKDSLAENLGPAMAQGYAISTMHCMTVSLAHGGLGLGSGTFGPESYRRIAQRAGFTSFALVGSNVVNNFYEIKGGTGASAM